MKKKKLTRIEIAEATHHIVVLVVLVILVVLVDLVILVVLVSFSCSSPFRPRLLFVLVVRVLSGPSHVYTNIPGVTSSIFFITRVGESVESALSALATIFSALCTYLNNF